jgi:hypothetical protein
MALARRLAFVAVFVVMLALPASAGAKLEFNLPAQIFKVFNKEGRSAVDPYRCEAVVFVEFPKIGHATSYRITVNVAGELEDFVAPPFDEFGRGFIQRYPAPKGFARFFIGAYSTPDDCPAADARTENSKIVEAKVSLDRTFEKRFRREQKPPFKCVFRPGDKRVKLSRSRDPRKVIVRRQGHVTTTEKSSNQPLNVFTNTYAVSGTIVRTGRDSVVAIGALDGNSVLVGPNMTVRITDRGFEVLEAPKHFRPWEVERSRSKKPYEVRTDCGAIAARG